MIILNYANGSISLTYILDRNGHYNHNDNMIKNKDSLAYELLSI